MSIASESQLATFRLANEWYGVDVLRVQELLSPMERTPVPRAVHQVLGLVNVRGVIATCISLRRRLGLDDGDGTHMNLVVASADGPVCLVVDEIGDVVPLASGTPVAAPPTIAATVRPFITGVLRRDDRLYTRLDVDRLCAP